MIVIIAMDFFGGTAVSRGARQHVQALLDAGHKVTVVADAFDQTVNSKIKQKFEKQLHTIVIRSIPLPRYYLIGREISFALQIYFILKKIDQKDSIKLIISQVSSACFGAVSFAKRRKIPTVFVIRALISDRIACNANPYDFPTTLLYKATNWYALNKMQYLLAISDYMKKLSIEEGAEERAVYVLHNPVDTVRFRPNDNIRKDVDIIYVGRHTVEKGIDTFLTAAEKFKPETRILIIGDGYLRESLTKRANLLSCSVEFTGWIDNKLLPKYIQRAKLQIVPSLSEPQGRVVLEAMACGVPVIGAATGGIPEMINDGQNGWLVPPGSSEKISEVVKEILSQRQVQIDAGREARKTALSFSLKQFNPKLVEIYEQMIAGI